MDMVVLKLIMYLQQLDHKNQYFIFTNTGPDDACLQETENFTIVTFPGSFIWWEQWKLPRMAKKYECDILHCTSNTAPLYSSVPLILTLHDIIYLEKNPLWQKGYTEYQRFGNFYRRLVVKKNLSYVKAIITVSEYEKQHLINFLSIDGDKVRVIHNGVGQHFYNNISDQDIHNMVEKYNLPEHYVLFLGNTDPKKNTPNTVLSFVHFCSGRSEDYKMVVVDLDVSVVKNILRKAGLSKYISRFVFPGYIPNHELPVLLHRAVLFMYTSKRESFGIPILEAMASGTPVITSNATSMPEVAGNAAILVDPDNIEEMAAAINRLIDQPQLRKELISRGHQRAYKFNWQNATYEMWEVYQGFNSDKAITE